MKKLKLNLTLFRNFFKIGLFTFGGGLAMLPMIDRIVVEKHGWLTADEVTDMVAVAESTPGVISVNLATYTGYKLNRFFGALFATLGVVLPSFIIIIIISLFYDKFMEIKVIKWAFTGIKACVAVLILNAALKLSKRCPDNLYSALTFAASFMISLFVPAVSAVWIILIGILIGTVYYAITERVKEKKEGEK